MLASFLQLLKIYSISVSLLTFCYPRFSHSLFFNITSFNSETDNIAFEGDAAPSVNGAIELSSINYQWRVGHLTYDQPIRLWDSTKGVLTDFRTRFSFSIDPKVSMQYSDGIVFYMAHTGHSIPPNSGGGYLGLFNTSSNENVSENRIVMVEFDTFSNFEYDPPDVDRHVGINQNSLSSSSHTKFDIEGNEGKKGHVLITYNATTKYLDVYWSFTESLPETLPNSARLSLKIDLMKVLPEWIKIGFSAATGINPQRHAIHSWEFSSTLNSTDSTTGRSGERKSNVLLIVSVTCSLSLVILVVCLCWYLVNRGRSKLPDNSNQNSTDFDITATIPRGFHYNELVAATNGFAKNRKLGQGGSGQVYKGVLNDLGRVIAVKRIFPEHGSSKRIFINEMKIISRLIHRNLVQFIGWFHEQGELLLAFEYMSNGSLDTHLFGHKEILPWNVRYNIAQGVVTAIRYLHEEAEQCVLHRDIKSANIMLDTDFNAKLGDFGIAKLINTKLKTRKTALVGTIGYLAPEYINEGRATKASDIYSIGVVALEIACGRRTYLKGGYHISLVNWVWKLYVEDNILNAADERLNMDFDVNEMKCLLTVGLWCTNPNDKKRPKASQVINVLKHEVSLPALPNNMHDFAFCSNPIQGQYNSCQSQPITTTLRSVGR